MYIAGFGIPVFIDIWTVARKEVWYVDVLVSDALQLKMLGRVLAVPFSRRHPTVGRFSFSMRKQLQELSYSPLKRDHSLLDRVDSAISRPRVPPNLTISARPPPPPPKSDAENDDAVVDKDDIDFVLEDPLVKLWLQVRGWQQVSQARPTWPVT